LHEALVAADVDLARIALNDEDEVDALAFRSTGSLQTLAAAASRGSTPLTPSEQEFARRLGRAIAGIEALRDLRPDIGAGRLRLPLDTLEQAGIDAERLLDEPMPAALAQLLAARKSQLATELQALPAILDRGARATQRQGLVLGQLHAQLLARIDHTHQVARIRAEVPPWSRFWTAWRTAIRHG
jgi:phytoene/squalene synthetase